MDRKPPTSKRYPDELKERAVKMVLDLQRSDPNDHGVIGRVSRQLGIGSESLRSWVKRAQIESGTRGGMTEAQTAELKDLRKEVVSLQTRLKWINILAVPLAVTATGIVIAAVNRRKTSAK